MILHTEHAALLVVLQVSSIFTCLLVVSRTLSCLLSIHPEPVLLPASEIIVANCDSCFCERVTAVYIKAGLGLQTHSQRP